MHEIAVTAMGADRPGIVAALTGGLHDLGGNLQDVRAALLGGSFAIVLLVELPDDVSAQDVVRTLTPDAERLGMGLWAGKAAADTAPPVPRERCVVSVYGIDRPGIVHTVTTAMADHGANIRDLSSRAIGTPPIYTLAIEADLPARSTCADLQRALRTVAEQNHVELAITPVDDDVL